MANYKILLVEDESIESMDIKRTLKSFGYDVPYVAYSGKEAVDKKALEIMPDIIIMDTVLKSDTDGIKAASIIKELDIPVIYLTSRSEEPAIQKTQLSAPYGYIIKPYHRTELKYAIELAIYKNQMEKELMQSEKRFRHILENSVDAAYRRNLDIDEYDYLSPVIEQVLGYSAEDFISMPSTKVVELIHPHDREKVNNIFANALSGKTNTYNIEYRFKHKDGHYKWINDFGSIVQDKDIMFLIGSVHDISERKKGEERRKKGEERRKKGEKALRESEEKYRKLFESNPDYTILVGGDGVIVDFNVAAEQIIGMSKNDLVGKHFMELGIFPKEDLDLLEEKFSHLINYGNLDLFEFRIIDKKGNIRWGETSLTLIMRENAPPYILVIFNDITKRKIAENKLESSKIQLVNAMEMSNLVNWEYDVASDTFTFDNRFYDLYATSAEMEGSHLMSSEVYAHEFVHPDDRDMVADEVKKAIETSDPDYVSQVDHRIIRRDGIIRHLVVRIAIMKDDEGRTIKTHGTNQDITELKEKEEEIKKSLEEKEVLLREIHHRVKNNMQIISSLLNLQIQHVEEREAVSVLKESQGRVKSMAMLHEKLYQSPNFTNINFKEYVERLVLDIFYSYGITTGSIESILDIENINIGIETAIPLGLIINELVTNSVKYAFPKNKGKIKIEFKSSEDELELIAADDGIGLPKDIDPENTETLGLELVNSLTDQIDGDIELDRSNGTKFKITFKELQYKERI